MKIPKQFLKRKNLFRRIRAAEEVTAQHCDELDAIHENEMDTEGELDDIDKRVTMIEEALVVVHARLTKAGIT